MSGEGAEESALEELEQVLRNVEDPETASVYRRHRYAIARRHATVGPMHELYNFPVLNGNFSLETLMAMVEEIFRDRTRPFRLNFALGYILHYVPGNEPARYFHPFRNVHELQRSVYVSSHRDIDALRRRLERMNFEERIMTQRPGSAWAVSLLTNVRFQVVDSSLTQPIGCRGVKLPAFLNRMSSVIDFPNRSDNLCFFRCLARYFGAPCDEVDDYALRFFSIWNPRGDVACFEGVTESELDELEDLFQVNVTIFYLQPDRRAETVRASTTSYGRTMYLNVYDGHVSLITRPDEYSHKYVCAKCSMAFPRVDTKKVHEARCRGDDEEGDGNLDTSNRQYVGGYFKERPGVFQRMREALVPVDKEQEKYDWFACFDVECLLKDLPSNEEANSACLSEHQCVSIAVSSNVPGFTEAVCFVDHSPSKLVEEMLAYLRRVQEKASELVRTQLKDPHEMLQDKMNNSGCKKESKELRCLLTDLELFCDRLPVLGFNSSRSVRLGTLVRLTPAALEDRLFPVFSPIFYIFQVRHFDPERAPTTSALFTGR